jgi:hypothetical protein
MRVSCERGAPRSAARNIGLCSLRELIQRDNVPTVRDVLHRTDEHRAVGRGLEDSCREDTDESPPDLARFVLIGLGGDGVSEQNVQDVTRKG